MSRTIVQPVVKNTKNSPARPRRNAPMPSIIKPVLPPIHNRRLIDSALGSRPSTPRTTAKEEAKVEVCQLPLHSVDSMHRLEDALASEPATSRSAALLDVIPLLGQKGINQEEALDEVMKKCHWQNSTVSEIDFRVYHMLTQALFTLIRDMYEANQMNVVFFKALAIAFRVIPPSDRELLQVVVTLLYRLSRVSDFDNMFKECQMIQKLVQIAFTEYGELSLYSAAILRYVANNKDNAQEILKCDSIKMICKALNTSVRRERFKSDYALFTYQVISLFAALYDSITDFSEICKYSLPLYLLDIVTIYMTDIGIQAAVSKALTLMMTVKECVEVLEGENLTPFFILLQSKTPKIVASTALALANAMNISDYIIDGVCEVTMPLGLTQLCEMLKSLSNDSSNIQLKLSILRCLAKASQLKNGIEPIMLYLNALEPLLATPLDDLETWTDEQMIVANTLIILKFAAMIDNKKVCNIMRGKMDSLMNYGIIDYVIDLMKILMKTEEGKEVCREVSEIEEIKLLLGEI